MNLFANNYNLIRFINIITCNDKLFRYTNLLNNSLVNNYLMFLLIESHSVDNEFY